MNESNNFLGTVWFLKDVEASWWDRSAFLLGHLALERIHEGGLGEDLMVGVDRGDDGEMVASSQRALVEVNANH